MLVLSRKSQQSIRIGDSITVTIVRVKGNTVRLGIEAPDSVKIVRSELPDFRGADAENASSEGTGTAPAKLEVESSEPYLVKHFRVRGTTPPEVASQAPRPSSTPPPVCLQRSATPLPMPRPR